MKISAKLSVVLAAIFASICYGVAIQGFMALGTLEGQVREDALGFAWFWVFLGTVAVAFGAVGVWLVSTGKADDA